MSYWYTTMPIYVLLMASFTLQEQSWVVAMKILWTAKCTVFTICPVMGKKFGSPQTKGIFRDWSNWNTVL
jgi:hypothetical protein